MHASDVLCEYQNTTCGLTRSAARCLRCRTVAGIQEADRTALCRIPVGIKICRIGLGCRVKHDRERYACRVPRDAILNSGL